MDTTTETSRIFRVLRVDGQEFSFVANTICDVNRHGTFFRFKRDGDVIGEIQGDMHAWWVDDGTSGKTWHLELAGCQVAIVADELHNVEEPRSCQQFKRSGELVATVYTAYHTWSVDG